MVQKANDKYFGHLYSLLFFSFEDQINLVTTFRMSYLLPFSQRKVNYEIRSFVLYISKEKCSLLNISERRAHIRIPYTDTRGKNIIVSPVSCYSNTFSLILLKESIVKYIQSTQLFFASTFINSRYM